MNPIVEQLYADYLQRTDSDTTAAASLTLADVMQSTRDADRVEATLPGQPLTVIEAAKRLNISVSKVYKMCLAGELRCFKIGRSIRISVADIDMYQKESAVAKRPQRFSHFKLR